MKKSESKSLLVPPSPDLNFFLLSLLKEAKKIWERVVQEYPDEDNANLCRAFLKELKEKPERIEVFYRKLLWSYGDPILESTE